MAVGQTESTNAEHAVLVHLKLSDDEFGDFEERESVFRLEDEIEPRFQSGTVGEYDGHEFAQGFATLYMYGPDADALFEVVAESLRKYGPRPGSYAVKRYGAVGAREERISL